MNLWTKAMILLIVTNSLDSRDQIKGLKTVNLRDNSDDLANLMTCSDSAGLQELVLLACSGLKWTTKATQTKAEATQRMCCMAMDSNCMLSQFEKKNCEVKDGYDEYRQKERKRNKDDCIALGVDLDKDCERLKKSVPEECDKFACSSAQKSMALSLALIVVTFVAIFVFF